MYEYDMNCLCTAYHCGGLMAIYAAIQQAAMPNVKAGIMERYYSSAMQTPALVLGQLSRRSIYHLEKIEKKWLADRYREKLQQVSVVLGKSLSHEASAQVASADQGFYFATGSSVAQGMSIPATLNLEQQSNFALGYYLMGAMLNKERQDRIAAKEKAAAN